MYSHMNTCPLCSLQSFSHYSFIQKVLITHLVFAWPCCRYKEESHGCKRQQEASSSSGHQLYFRYSARSTLPQIKCTQTVIGDSISCHMVEWHKIEMKMLPHEINNLICFLGYNTTETDCLCCFLGPAMWTFPSQFF